LQGPATVDYTCRKDLPDIISHIFNEVGARIAIVLRAPAGLGKHKSLNARVEDSNDIDVY
jgi:hypothetical protein